MAKALILGLGNTLRGDDGVGAAVVAALRDHELPPQVDVIDGGTPGLETVLIWRGYDRVIIVDAAEMGMQPGKWKRFLPDDAIFPSSNNKLKGTLHNAGLAEAVALAEALELLPRELVFYCVQPAYTGWSRVLTASVDATIPTVCAAIFAELGALSGQATRPLPE